MKKLKIGVISDTHDHIENAKKAVKIFNEREVAYVFHAGDFIAPFIISKALSELKCKLIGVFGNNDGERLGLKEMFTKIGGIIKGIQFSIQINDKKIALFHSIVTEIQDSIINSNKFDIVIYGHTHESLIKKINKTLVINPGESCGYLTGKSTVGIIDLDKMKAELIEL
ncbi:MAG: metallophosphoesterase [Promethearchaeota archaeon]